MHKQYLTPVKSGTIDDVKRGTHIVFEETDEKGRLHQCTGLEYMVKIEPNIVIVDNHDRVLEFRPQGLPVIHLDQHTDLCPVGPEGVNVGNFLRYALDTGHTPSAIQINTEYSLLKMDIPSLVSREGKGGIILDIDLDFRAPEMGIERYEQTIQKTKDLIKEATFISIATSPYFLDQSLALKVLKDILE